MNTAKIVAAAIATIMTVALFAAANTMANGVYDVAKIEAGTTTQIVVANANTTIVVTAHRAA